MFKAKTVFVIFLISISDQENSRLSKCQKTKETTSRVWIQKLESKALDLSNHVWIWSNAMQKLYLDFGQEVSANVGLNVDTGVDIRPDTVAASVAGFGGSIGRTIGVSTPLGGIKFKLWWIICVLHFELNAKYSWKKIPPNRLLTTPNIFLHVMWELRGKKGYKWKKFYRVNVTYADFFLQKQKVFSWRLFCNEHLSYN